MTLISIHFYWRITSYMLEICFHIMNKVNSYQGKLNHKN
ncbi:hypothetical protein Patl1_28011 [Pistacia atlantica]|uniref:Uncharacterized protein n=1 Tax=Pistacia atlantica TaxID=434234 RepID=A0ACC1BDS6_9ROSI|nr:hypothetical protein Patl1_28011 [Pistacia atlantica]